jgi:hypothetical protein
MDATANDDDDDAIYTSSSSSLAVVAFPSKGGSGGKRHSNATSAVGVVAAPPRPTPPPATGHQPPAISQPPPATDAMRQLAKEIAGDIQEWTGSARFIDGLDSDQLIALISWLWLWDILYNQHDLYEETWARQRYPKNPFENLRTIPGKIITQARQGNPYPLHPLDSQDLQLVLTERMKGNLIRRPPTPEVSPESEVNDRPEPSRSSRSGEPSVVDPERCDEQAAVDSELRTQDSGLRTQDFGLRTSD